MAEPGMSVDEWRQCCRDTPREYRARLRLEVDGDWQALRAWCVLGELPEVVDDARVPHGHE